MITIMNFALIIIVIMVIFYFRNFKENYSQAAIIQLTAKGHQDTYLTGDAYKYFPSWFYNYYNYYFYPRYTPTKFRRRNRRYNGNYGYYYR